MKCNYRYCGKEINFGRPDRKFCNKNCKMKENKLIKEIKSLDNKSIKTKDFIEKSKDPISLFSIAIKNNYISKNNVKEKYYIDTNYKNYNNCANDMTIKIKEKQNKIFKNDVFISIHLFLLN